MLEALMKKWKVGRKDLFLILCVFAVTGTSTAYIGKAIAGWAGFTESTPWAWKFLLRLAVFVVGYQLILLCVAFLFGQFPFFWRFEKKLLQRLGIIKKTSTMDGIDKREEEIKNVSRMRLAVFASGTGSNAEKIIQYFKSSPLAEVALVVCNKPGAGVLAIAEKEGVPVLLIERERFLRGDAYVAFLEEKGIGFLVLAGFLWKVPEALVAAYPRRIVNIHPALLPKFGGRGMYGQYVHEAVLNAGEVESGITIHYVDEHYDNGDIIFQTACPILPGDKPGDIAQRIHQLEHVHYPRVIEGLLEELGNGKQE
jgi:formyltetrahydrofolate-dependent phosphoribosylglycinamide formyltransferase